MLKNKNATPYVKQNSLMTFSTCKTQSMTVKKDSHKLITIQSNFNNFFNRNVYDEIIRSLYFFPLLPEIITGNQIKIISG